jgi:hypothetical protein
MWGRRLEREVSLETVVASLFQSLLLVWRSRHLREVQGFGEPEHMACGHQQLEMRDKGQS